MDYFNNERCLDSKGHIIQSQNGAGVCLRGFSFFITHIGSNLQLLLIKEMISIDFLASHYYDSFLFIVVPLSRSCSLGSYSLLLTVRARKFFSFSLSCVGWEAILLPWPLGPGSFSPLLSAAWAGKLFSSPAHTGKETFFLFSQSLGLGSSSLLVI